VGLGLRPGRAGPLLLAAAHHLHAESGIGRHYYSEILYLALWRG
jgi:hypothetical protein